MRLSLEKKNNNNNNKRSRFNRVLCTIGARSLIKAASSDGRDLAPGSPLTAGFRKKGNGEQYAFKKVIERNMSKSFIFTKPAASGGAMSITEH